jgi:predicted phage terminase large subunit-like protein
MEETKPKKKRLAKNEFRPQPGPQEQFLGSSADIVLFGGAAGGGKSFAILMECLRHTPTNSEFSAVIFRRNSTQVRNPGGLWDEAFKLFPFSGARAVSHQLEWRWKDGGKVKMAHLENENTVLDWQGAQVPLIMFDELTHFSKNQFFYMLSRNRSLCGVRPYVRATTNPDADSWVADFIEWWIDEKTGYPIPERSGVVRWFIRLQDTIVWGDSRKQLIAEYGKEVEPKSFTFIPARLEDNQILMRNDPGYRANLLALSRVERERLLGGNWKIRPVAGMYFKRTEITILEEVPSDITGFIRYWDLAATEVSDTSPNPDWTAGVKIGLRKNGRYVVLHVIRARERSGKIRELVKNTALIDGYSCLVGLAQDPGQAGKDQVESYVQDLAGFAVRTNRVTGDKVTRAEPFAAQWQHGNIDVVRGAWNEAYFDELEAFPSTAHDDQVDASADAFNELAQDSLMTWQRLGRS